MSSNNLDKYEYLTGEDLNLKPSTVEQAKFEYSPLGRVFNKGLNKEAKKEGILERLENIEKNQDRNNNESNLSSERRKSSKKTSISDDDDKLKTSFVYLEDNTEVFFWRLFRYF